MFKRNKCSKCKKSISKKFEYCPYCGSHVDDNEDYGMLGKNDSNEIEQFSKGLFGGIGGKMMNRMLGSAMKMLEKELQKEMKDMKKQPMPKSNFQFFINGKKVNIDDMDMPTMNQKIPTRKKQKIILPHPSEDTISSSKDLPRKEASSKLKRIHNKVVYEIDLPGVNSIDNVLINKLEGSTEVKAFAKNKVLFKNLPVTLPLIAYHLKDRKLFLEFQGK